MARIKKTVPDSIHLAVVADLLRVTVRRVSYMFDEGKLAKKDGGVSVVSLAAYLAQKEQAAAPDDYEANKARKMKADADLAEIEAKKAAGKLFDAARTKKAWDSAVLSARAKLLGLPERVGQQVLTAPDVAAAKKILAAEIHDTLVSLASAKEDKIPDAEPVEDETNEDPDHEQEND